tara:strand:+ start:5576 stop:6415 length:840 start_codon:yes stop_codon:yes gene_type:complete
MSEEVQAVEEAPTTPPPTTTPTVEEAPTESDWKSSLPEDLRSNPNFAKYTSMESFAKGHLNAVSMLGKEPELKVPDNEDERAEFYNKLGRPATNEEYQFKSFEVPDNLQEYVSHREQSFREVSHKIGLSSTQASELHEWYMQGNADTAKQAEEITAQNQKEGFNALKSDWGEAYDKNLQSSQFALSEFADEEFVEYLESTGLGDHPSMIKIFHKISEGMIGEGKLEAGNDGSSTPEQLDTEIKSIMANPDYWNENSLERPALVKKVQDLMSRKHPEPLS